MISLIADNLQEAMVKVKERLGPSASIVSWKNLGDKIEVTATSSETKSDILENGRDGFTQKGISPRYDVFAHEEELQKKEKSIREKALLQHAQKLKANQVQKPKSTKSTGIENLVKPRAQKPIEIKTPTKIHELVKILANSGLSLKEIKPFLKYFGEKPARETLIEILQSEFKFTPIDAAPNMAIALVGAAGSGKTAAAAKLAARSISAQIDTLLISTDTERQGGVEQLKILAKRLGASFNYAESAHVARNITQSALDAGKVVIIDCAASSPLEPASMRVLQGLMFETMAEPIFCAPADFRHDDLRDFTKAFIDIGSKRSIITRIDLTQRRAGFMSAFLGLEMAIAQLSPSPFIAGGLVKASPKRLADFIIDAWD